MVGSENTCEGLIVVGGLRDTAPRTWSDSVAASEDRQDAPDTPARFDVRHHGTTPRRDRKGRDDRSIRRRSTRTMLYRLSGVQRPPAPGG